MKKLWAFLLAFAMVAAMGAPALAEDTTTDTNTATNNGKTDTSIAVNGLHTPTITPTVISADIAWDPMDFTYNVKGQMWDPATHKFTENTESGWVWTYKTETQRSPHITVTNHSNINLTAEPKFDAAEGITGVFSSTDPTLYLRSAEDTAPDNPPKRYTTFSISSGSAPITESKDIGTITVTIKKGTTTEVANESDLKKIALITPSVVLTNNIILTSQLPYDNFSGIIDLAGYTLTSNDNSDEGGIVFKSGNSYLKQGHLITIKNGTITGNASKLLHFGQDSNGAVDVTMKNCTIDTEATNSGTDYAIWVDGATLRLQDCTINSAGAVGLNITQNSSWKGIGKVILSGDIRINGGTAYGLDSSSGCSITCLAGTYSFDPTNFVNGDIYDVTKDEATGIWTVTAK